MLPSLASSACFPCSGAGPAFRLSLACCRRNLVTERRWNAVQQLTGLPANVLVALADFPGTPLCGACVPAVLPGLAAVAGPAESAAGRPAHVRPEACLLLKGCTVQAVCGVDESEALHKGPCLEQPPSSRWTTGSPQSWRQSWTAARWRRQLRPWPRQQPWPPRTDRWPRTEAASQRCSSLTTILSNKADQSAFDVLEGVVATKSTPDGVDLKLSNYSTTAAMNGSIASANNATLATVAANYGLWTSTP